MKANVHEALSVTLLLTGFCVPSTSSPFSNYFVNEKKTFDDALLHCRLEHIDMAQILSQEDSDAVMKTPTGSYTGNAWFGLYENSSHWIWANGEIATYFNWIPDEPIEVYGPERCVVMDNNGSWINVTCSSRHGSICFNGSHYEMIGMEMTWEEAARNCEGKHSTLPDILNEDQNVAVLQHRSTSPYLWIGLSRPRLWFWSETEEEISSFINWEPGRPSVLSEDSCAAVSLHDGTWTNEPCSTEKPFFCFGISTSRQTLVKMVIESSGNLEDGVIGVQLQQQIVAALTEKGVTDLKLTWNKLPMKVKQIQQGTEDDC